MIISANLIGTISPTDSDHGFRIPVFQNASVSNSLLVQRLGSNGNIIEFEEFQSDVEIDRRVPALVRCKGDPAYWYFGLNNQHSLHGSITEIRKQAELTNNLESESVSTKLQISEACGLTELRQQALTGMYRFIKETVGEATALHWLDVHVITPKIRVFIRLALGKLSRNARKGIFEADALTLTNRQEIYVILSRPIFDALGQDRSAIADEAMSAAFDFINIDQVTVKAFNVPESRSTEVLAAPTHAALKRRMADRFGFQIQTRFDHVTQSSFENHNREIRIVCTLSKRHEGKGQRKYWFGYHRSWDVWLDRSDEAYLILGLTDCFVGYAIPIGLLRTLLPSLRITERPSGKYWHLDVLEDARGQTFLGLPRAGDPVCIDQHRFAF